MRSRPRRIIERAVEVYVSKCYDPEKLRVRRPLTRAEAMVANAEKALTEERERLQGSFRAPTQEDRDYTDVRRSCEPGVARCLQVRRPH